MATEVLEKRDKSCSHAERSIRSFGISDITYKIIMCGICDRVPTPTG